MTMSAETKGKDSTKNSIEDIRKYLDFIDQCVANHSFEDIPEQISCIRDELDKLDEDK